jgi:GTP-binding protein
MTSPDPAAEANEAARLLFARPATFMLSVVSLEQLPPGDVPEVAFAGRSNVGKSSLINALVGQEGLARTSNTPGRTQQLNFFDLGGRLRLVDLPGYGYAEAPKEKVDVWNQLIRDYLRGRPNLARVYVLVDARHGIKKNDEEVLSLLDKAAVSYQLVLTKIDKVKPGGLEAVTAKVAEAIRKRPAAHPDVIATSAEKGTGIDLLREAIARLLAERVGLR